MKWVFALVLILLYLFELLLFILNYRHSLKETPARLQDIYDEDRYQKWLAYFRELGRFDIIEKAFNLLVLLIFLLFLVAPMETFLAGRIAHLVLETLLFMGFYWVVKNILALPWQAYRIFSIEERHGFNRTSAKTFWKDRLINFLVLILLEGLIVFASHSLFLRFGANVWQFIILVWLSISFLLFVFVAFLNRIFFRLFNKFTPLPPGTLRDRIEDLARKVGYSVKAINVMDASRRSSKLNAFCTGIGRTKEIALYDTLLEKAGEDEILAVLGHELGHAIYHDMWANLLLQSAMFLIYAVFVAFLVSKPVLFQAFGLSGVHFGFALFLFFYFFEPILDLFLGIIYNYFSRRMEYRADEFAADHTRPQDIIGALKILGRENLTNLNPHPWTILFRYSHPPLNDRIKALEI